MRKIISVILSVALCISLSSCGKKTSNLPIETFELFLKTIDKDFSFDLVENENGYDLSYVDGYYKYSGKADKEKNITEYTLTYDGLSYSGTVDLSLMTEENLNEIKKKDSYDRTQHELHTIVLFYNVGFLLAATELGDMSEENNEDKQNKKTLQERK